MTRHDEATDTRNAPIIAAQAIPPDTPLLNRRPKLALIRKPANGSNGIRISMPLPLQRGEHVGIQRFAMAEQADHDGQANRGFGGGNGHHEEHDDLAVRRAERAPEGDEAQVHGVQHDLDREQDGDEIPPNEHAGRTDRKQNRGQHEVVAERRHQRDSFFASTTAPTMATRIRIEVTSNANWYSVNRV